MMETRTSSTVAAADAKATFLRSNKKSMMNFAGTSEEMPGPPRVSTSTSSYIFTVPSESKKTALTILPLKEGKMMWR